MVSVMHDARCTSVRSSPIRHGASGIRETVITSVANKTRGFRVYGFEKHDEKTKPMVRVKCVLPIFFKHSPLGEVFKKNGKDTKWQNQRKHKLSNFSQSNWSRVFGSSTPILLMLKVKL
tara:strand:+ start:221 stop:577 length:357 start_codon:yes stop_codon:yes gene_type:complete